MAPADSTTSFSALTNVGILPSFDISTPVARPFSTTTFNACVCRLMWRFGRSLTGLKNALAVLHLKPSLSVPKIEM